MPPGDQRSGRGRRDDDRALDYVVERLRILERRLNEEIDKLEADNDRLHDAIDDRVRELEAFHIAEQTRAGERTAQAVGHARRISSLGAGAGALGVALAIVEHFAHI